MSITILLVDDQPLLRLGFRLILESDPDMTVVGETGEGSAAVAEAARLRPDVVLMDVRMPGMDGLQATAEITAGPGASRVLILTTFDLDEYVFSGLRAGASGFLLKDIPPAELLSAIRSVAAGDAVVSPRATRRLLETFGRHLEPVTPPPGGADLLSSLTDRERDVFRLVVDGLSNREIADRLFLVEATVKTHVSRVLGKLSLRDRVQAVVLAYESGLVRPGGRSALDPEA